MRKHELYNVSENDRPSRVMQLYNVPAYSIPTNLQPISAHHLGQGTHHEVTFDPALRLDAENKRGRHEQNLVVRQGLICTWPPNDQMGRRIK